MCAIRPRVEDEDAVAELLGDFDEPEGAAEDAVSSIMVNDAEEVRLDIDDAVGETEPTIAQAPRGMPSPNQPTAEEIALHWLTHLRYRSW